MFYTHSFLGNDNTTKGYQAALSVVSRYKGEPSKAVQQIKSLVKSLENDLYSIYRGGAEQFTRHDQMQFIALGRSFYNFTDAAKQVFGENLDPLQMANPAAYQQLAASINKVGQMIQSIKEWQITSSIDAYAAEARSKGIYEREDVQRVLQSRAGQGTGVSIPVMVAGAAGLGLLGYMAFKG